MLQSGCVFLHLCVTLILFNSPVMAILKDTSNKAEFMGFVIFKALNIVLNSNHRPGLEAL